MGCVLPVPGRVFIDGFARSLEGIFALSESTPLLATKLYLPPLRPNVVSRPRLLERLNTGLHRKLTLLAAPAGFGKTTLLSEWIARCGRPVAWLSLDEGDNDPTRFLAYLVAALQTITPRMGAGIGALLQSSQPPRERAGREALLTALLNEITALSAPFVLILDDYHVVDVGGLLGAVDQMLSFLVEHLPPSMHLVIATREDPPLPLARLRVRGQLTELRAADLRFTPAEAADFLNQAMGLSLTAQEIATLEERTEGWIAGLQLAALSLQEHQDVPSFIQSFAGDHRYIVDYLVEEVLKRQPLPVRHFLLQTAILDRLNGSLCDAITGQQEGNARLEALQRGNFFVVPLDDKRHWYRYHHLFAEVLHAHLVAEQPDQLSTLHQRASAWYAQHEMAVDAIRHALAARDFARAAELVELAVPAMRRNRQEAILLGWLRALPDAVIYGRPVLSAVYAGTLLQSGELEGVEARLRDAEQWLDASLIPTKGEYAVADVDEVAHPQGMIIVDQEEFRCLPGWLANYRAAHALVRGDVHDTLHYAQRALDLMPADEYFGRGAATALLGLAYWTHGKLDAAHQTYAAGMAHVQRAGYLADAIGGAIALADIRITQGRLREAMRTYEQALQLATAPRPDGSHALLRGTVDMYVGISELYRERNDLHTAREYLRRSQEVGDHMGFPQQPYRRRVAMARLLEAEGDLDAALALLQEAERLYVSDFYPNVRPVAALKTRVWLAQGRLGEALNWVREQGLSTDDDLSYLHEFEHITLARVLLACYQRDQAAPTLAEATRLLERLLQAAEAGGRMGRAIEILILQALAHHAQSDSAAALLPLERALTLAAGPTEAEDYIRLFVDEGPPMAELLTRQKAQGGRHKTYIHTLLTAFGTPKALRSSPVHPQPLVEPLSERELEVLRLLGTELNGPEIARNLMISLNTLRTHTKNIYSKLGVNNRRTAARRAEELSLY